ncbi:MAG: glutamate--tRNA ligase [Candidatus Doudnabacteria bacterium]|nr:glutamate--tRNA ligase [Candidatus Doudnabacteria bacterium]
MPKDIRTRFAPSPTGMLHIGGLRTALYEYLWARKNNGKFILRIEDTDVKRSVAGSLENIVQIFDEFKLTADEGPYWDNGIKERGDYGPYLQSKRLDLYKQHAHQLVAKGAAYHCFCSEERLKRLREDQQAKKQPPKYDKHCLNLSASEVKAKLEQSEGHVIRLNVKPGEKIGFEDVIHGKIEIMSDEVDDQILIKSDSYPTYHLAVVVDDYLMKISHVIRADEWISSTPKHILLYRAFGWELPVFVHLPPILSKVTGKKLAKREGEVSVRSFLDKGYLPEAILNFIAFQGWNPKSTQEVFNLRELVQEFSLEKLNKSGAIFDLDKLDWYNSHYIRDLDISELTAKLTPYLKQADINPENYSQEFIQKILALEQARLKKLSEIGERVRYFFEDPSYEQGLLIWKKSTKESILKSLESLQVFLQSLPSNKFKKNNLEDQIKKFIQDRGLKTGEVLWPLRVALTGLEASPGPFEIMDVFGVLENGKEIILKRVNTAIEKLF